MAVKRIVAFAAAGLFGAADQYLGSVWSLTHLGAWTADVSMMSAPWLALPFLFGARAPRGSRAVIDGTVATLLALLGYFAMTLSPIEGVTLAQVHPLAFASSQLHIILPAAVTGPLWGWLGYRWRTGRSWLSPTLLAVAFSLEPLARSVDHQPFATAGVSAAEVALGGLLLVVTATGAIRRPRAPRA